VAAGRMRGPLRFKSPVPTAPSASDKQTMFVRPGLDGIAEHHSESDGYDDATRTA